MIANKKNLVNAIAEESTPYLPSELLKLNLVIKKKRKEKKRRLCIFFKQLNERGNWFKIFSKKTLIKKKIFSKKTREFNTIELKGCNLTHQTCTILPSKNIHQNIDL